MKMNQFGGSRTDTLIKFILVFFISLLSFSVGTFVGKQFSDSQHRLAQLNTDYEKSESEMRETASIPEGQMNVEPEKALTDEDVAKLAEDFVAEDSVDTIEVKNVGSNVVSAAEPKRDVASKDAPAPAKVETNPHGTTVDTAADKVANGQPAVAPQPIEIKVRKPELPNTVAATTIGKFTVQIASQPSEELAKGQSLKLKDEGYSAFYVEGAKDGKKWYRVNIGMFSTKKDATDYAKKLGEKAEFKGAFVKEIVQ